MPPPARAPESAFAHALPYWYFGDGALVLTDGTLVRGFRLAGVSVSNLPNAELNVKAGFLRAFLNSLPVGYHVQLLRASRPVHEGYFQAYEDLAQGPHVHPLLKEGRRESAAFLRGLKLRASDCYLLLSKPRAFGRLGDYSRTLSSRLVDMLTGHRHPGTLTREEHEAAVQEVHDKTRSLARGLEASGVGVSALSDEDLAALVFRFLNPTRSRLFTPPLTARPPPSALPEEQRHLYRALSLREQLVQTPLTWGPDALYLDDPMRPFRVMGLKELPKWTEACFSQGASLLSFPHWLSISMGVPDSEARYNQVEKRRNRAISLAAGYAQNVKASEHAGELEEAMRAMTSRDQRVYELSLHLLFDGKDLVQLDRRTEEAAEVFAKHLHTPLTTEQMAQLDAYLGMLPGNAHRALRPRTVLTDNAADFLHVFDAPRGAQRPLFLATTRTKEPFPIDVCNPAADNWNWNVIGQSGGGKSFLVLTLATTSILALGSPLIVIDVGGKENGSYYRLVQMLGGDFVSVALDGSMAINPFFSREDLYTDDEGAPAREPNASKVLFLAGLTKILVTDPGAPPPTIIASSIIEACILAAYARLGDSRPPIFSDVAEELERYRGEDAESTALSRRLAKTLRAQLATSRARVINSQTRVNIRSSFIVFDLKGLEDLGDFGTVVLLVISAYVWNMVGRKRSGDGWLAWIVYDEVWKLLQDRAAARLVAELYRTARKLKTGVMAITQQLTDFLAVPEAAAIIEQAPNTALLKHQKGHDKVVELLGLNPREEELFRSLNSQKGEYSEVLLKQDRATAVVQVRPSPFQYWLNTTDPKDKLLEEEVLRRCKGDRRATLLYLVEHHPSGAPREARKVQAA